MITPRFATAAEFLCFGLLYGTWVGQIPAFKRDLDVSAGELGVLLACIPAGSLVSIAISSQVVARLGSRRPLVTSSLLFCACLPLPLLAPTPVPAGFALLIFGATAAGMDIAMNAHGVVIEKSAGRPVFSSMHAMFSLGTLIGAGVSTLSRIADIAPLAHVVTVAAVIGVVCLLLGRRLGPDEAGVERPVARTFVLPSRKLIPLGLLALGALLAEGAMENWTGIYLTDVLDTNRRVASIGFTAFALGMTAGRLLGDGLVERIGSVNVVRFGCLASAVALGQALFVDQTIVALAGFALIGLGLANAFPLILSLAGKSGAPAGPSIAAVAGMGYLGLLIGPPIIGALADAIGLANALALICAVLCAIALFIGRAEDSQSDSAGDRSVI